MQFYNLFKPFPYFLLNSKGLEKALKTFEAELHFLIRHQKKVTQRAR